MRSTVTRAIVLSSEFSTRISRTTLTARATGSSARTPTTGPRWSRSGPSGSVSSRPGQAGRERRAPSLRPPAGGGTR